ncbi:MAG: phage portal protein [Clostridiaceae bacterium]|nr:phage portal protein [Clostridiaceae bacterium]
MDRLSGAKNFKAITNVPGWVDMLTADGVPDSLASLYKIVPVLYRVVQLRCDALSSAPVAIIRGKEDEVEWPYPTPLASLLWKWEASLLLSGAAFGEIITNKSGFRKDLRYRNPFDMSVKYEKGVIDFKQNSSGATWQNNLTDGKFEMVYFAEFDPSQDVLPGVGAGKASNVDVKLLYALSKFPEMYFEGGAMPVTLLGIDSADKGEIDRIQTWFRRSVTTIRNAFRVLGVRAGSITPTTLTPPMKDLAFPELSAIAKDNVALAFGIRKTMLDSEAANYATAQEDRLSFYEDVIKPRARIFEDALNEQLLARDGLRLEFRFNELDIFQEDESERADLLNNLTTAGLPIEVSLQLAGYKLTEEQLSMLEEHQEQLDSRIDEQPFDERTAELRKWQKFAEKRVKEGKPIREFETSRIDPALHGAISGALEGVKTVDDVRHLFDSVIAWRGYP